ncbi:NEQ184 [Nanoarchaeum equitans Kin4-M]|uniref:NEQ184 n=1 Tax=Nanoarchaeum equitans (strain Kin4-M) TaxID=228908 RepID=Q74MN6_NANEQ|nr:NEQ184 [Nanoarchaeum equitans Kin4-M]
MNEEVVLPPGYKVGKNAIGDVYKEGDYYYTKYISTIRKQGDKIKVIALTKVYTPSIGDNVIGIVYGLNPIGLEVNIEAPYKAIIPYKIVGDPLKFYNKIVFATISSISKVGIITLSNPKIVNGLLLKINPAKVARVIGKNGSMIKTIKEKFGVNIIVGKNGLIIIKGETKDVEMAAKVIKEIERRAHRKGLTDWVKNL